MMRETLDQGIAQSIYYDLIMTFMPTNIKASLVGKPKNVV